MRKTKKTNRKQALLILLLLLFAIGIICYSIGLSTDGMLGSDVWMEQEKCEIFQRISLSSKCENADASNSKNLKNDNNYLLLGGKSEQNINLDDGFSSEISSVLAEFYQLIDEFYTDDGYPTEDFGVDSALRSIVSVFAGGGGEGGRFLILLFGIALLFLVSEKLSDSFGDGRGAVMSAVGAVLSLPVVSALAELILSVRDGLDGAGRLFSGLIPIFTAISAIGGGAATSAAQCSGMSITLSVCSLLIRDALIPILMLMLALGLLSSFEIGGVSSLIKGFKGSFLFILGAVTTATAGVLALQSVITNAADSMALRGAKFAVSGMIPIVGGNISSALGALVSGVEAAKGTVGATSLIILIGILLSPLIQLLLARMCFRVCICFLEMTGGSLGAKVLSSLQGILDALISVIAFSGVIYILEVVIFLKLGVPGL